MGGSVASIFVGFMGVAACAFVIISRNGKKVKKVGPRYCNWITIFKKGKYYDISSDERFTKYGTIEKYGKDSFLCRVPFDDHEWKEYVRETLNLMPGDVNNNIKRW